MNSTQLELAVHLIRKQLWETRVNMDVEQEQSIVESCVVENNVAHDTHMTVPKLDC